MQTNKDTITSVAQDAKQGIPHVEGRKSKTPGKPLVAAAMLALCVLVGYNLYQNQDVKEQKTETSKAKENGNLVFINTGRTFSGITQPIFDLEFNGYVCGCGTHIYFDGKKIYSSVIPKEKCIESKCP